MTADLQKKKKKNALHFYSSRKLKLIKKSSRIKFALGVPKIIFTEPIVYSRF